MHILVVYEQVSIFFLVPNIDSGLMKRVLVYSHYICPDGVESSKEVYLFNTALFKVSYCRLLTLIIVNLSKLYIINNEDSSI